MFSPYLTVINFFTARESIDEYDVNYQGILSEFWEVPFGYDPTDEELLMRLPQNIPAGAFRSYYCYN